MYSGNENHRETKMKSITILLPTYNEEGSFLIIEECMQQVLKENPHYEWKFLFVNDGSTDGSLVQMMNLHLKDNRYNYIDLSRNYGKEIAMMAGFDYVDTDAVIIMDSDMQHPVEVIPEMIKWWEEGYDDVYATRKSSNETLFKRTSSKMYYRVLQSISKIPVLKDTGDFRLLDRTCVEALKKMREVDRNTKGMYGWIGFHKKGVFYEQKERLVGETKWDLWALLNLALTGITSYTTAPLRISTLLGLLVSFLAFGYLIWIVVKTIIWGEAVQGFPTIMITILFLGGVQLLSIGIVGEYLGHVFNESKRRPPYFVNSVNGVKC